MNKKIYKGYELVKAIEDGQELPKKIKVRNSIFEWVDIDTGKGYHNTQEKDWIIWLQDLISLDTKEELNETVEILEDNTEEIEEYKGESFEQLGYEIGKMSTAIVRGLIKAVNEMKEESEDKQ